MSGSHEKSERLVAQARAQGVVPAAVIYPCSSEALKGALEAAEAGLVEPLLVGPKSEIQRIADAAVNVAPKLRVKRDITQNAIDCAQATGISRPNVAVLSAVESVNEAMPSTVEAAALRDMAQRGEIVGGIVEGPLAFDNAISAHAARVKGIETRVAGKVDILIVPGIEAGNILYKSLVYLSDAIAAGVVMGLRAPVVLTSRAAGPASRVASAAMACLLVHHSKRAVAGA
jgi:phosphotransacetylase